MQNVQNNVVLMRSEISTRDIAFYAGSIDVLAEIGVHLCESFNSRNTKYKYALYLKALIQHW